MDDTLKSFKGVKAKYIDNHPSDIYYITDRLGGMNFFDEHQEDYRFTKNRCIFPFDFDYFHVMLCFPVKFIDEIRPREDFISYRFQVIPYTIDRIFSYRIKSPRTTLHDLFKTEEEAVSYCECYNSKNQKRINYEFHFFELYCKLQLNILDHFT